MAKRNRIQIQPLVSVITLSINIKKNGVEIRFPTDPGDEARELLVEQGWRFNPYGATQEKWKDPTWYKRLTPETLQFARDLVQVLSGVDNTSPALAALAAAPQQLVPVPTAQQPSPLAVVPKAVPAQSIEAPPPVPTAEQMPAQAVAETVEIKVPALAA